MDVIATHKNLPQDVTSLCMVILHNQNYILLYALTYTIIELYCIYQGFSEAHLTLILVIIV